MSSNRSSEFYKALMVEAQRLQFEYEGLPLDRMWPQWALLTPVFFPCRDVDFDVSENTILDSQLFPEHFEQVTRSIFNQLDQRASTSLPLQFAPC